MNAITRRRWTLCLRKDAVKFSAAHFLIHADGSAERLHGHNYRVRVRVLAGRIEDGVVVDFADLKRIVRGVLEPLDERLLVPAHNRHLHIERPGDGSVELRVAGRRYRVPEEDVQVLPVANSSVECLSELIASHIAAELAAIPAGARVEAVEVGVEETSGQEGRARVALPRASDPEAPAAGSPQATSDTPMERRNGRGSPVLFIS